MKILFAASEAAPYIKTGGLGDVMEALPAEICKKTDDEVCVFLPYYKKIKFESDFCIELVKDFKTTLSWRNIYVGLFKAVSKNKKLTYYFIDNEYYFNRDDLYGYYDDGERFAYFCKAVLDSIQYIDFVPDIIHCNDWQTAAIPVLLNAFYRHSELYAKIKTVFTIHNIEYQGQVPDSFMEEILGLDEKYMPVLHLGDCVNLMKSAIVTADRITTVSKTYSFEIRNAYYARGLEGILSENGEKIRGIVNGINILLYNPKTDNCLEKNYSANDVSGKAACKQALQSELGLPERENVPVVAMIGRLVGHKGLELVKYVIGDIIARDIQFVVLGTGDKEFEDLFRNLQYANSEKMSINIKFDTCLANRIYAGADIFLMPSKSEPCGLAQLIAMRYGTIPIVRETGGLVDTVPPLNVVTLEGKGFTFKGYNAHDMLGAIDRAIAFYHEDKDKLSKLIKKLIKTDSSWDKPSMEYIDLYKEIT